MSQRLVTKPPTLDEPLQPTVPPNLRVRAMTKQDFDTVVLVVDQWWSGPIAVLAHPVFFYELGKNARVTANLRAPTIALDPSATLVGDLRIGPGEVPELENLAKPPPSEKAASA